MALSQTAAHIEPQDWTLHALQVSEVTDAVSTCEPHMEGLGPGDVQLMHGLQRHQGAPARDKGKDTAGQQGSQELSKDVDPGDVGTALEDG